MTKYISTIIYICIFSIILELILPNNKLKKYIGVLISLSIILVLTNPLIDFLSEDNVIDVVSNSIENLKLNMSFNNSNNDYDFSKYKDKIILSSVREKLENEILDSCNEKFKEKYKIKKVQITLNTDYEIESVDIYVKNIDQVFSAYEIIHYLEEKYSIKEFLIQVIKEE